MLKIPTSTMHSTLLLLIVPLLCEASQSMLRVSLKKPANFDVFKELKHAPNDPSSVTEEKTFCSEKYMIKCYRHHVKGIIDKTKEIGLAYILQETGNTVLAKAIASISEQSQCSKSVNPSGDAEKAFLLMNSCDIEDVNYQPGEPGKVEAMLENGLWMYCNGGVCKDDNTKANLPTMKWTEAK